MVIASPDDTHAALAIAAIEEQAHARDTAHGSAALGAASILLGQTIEYDIANVFDPAYTVVAKVPAFGILLSFGVALIACGLYYRTPFPVQPMKATGAVMATQASELMLTAQTVYCASMLTGVVWLLLAATGLAKRIAALVSRPVVLGIVLGLGIGFMLEGVRMIAEGWIIGVIALVGLNRVIDQQAVAREHTQRWQEIQLAMRLVTQDLAQLHPRATREELESVVGAKAASARCCRPVVYSPARSCPAGRPRTTTWARRSLPGLSRTGFIADVASTPAACAWRYCARPISEPSRQTIEWFDMFGAVYGATDRPRRARTRHSPVTTRDFPASEEVPVISSPLTSRHSTSAG